METQSENPDSSQAADQVTLGLTKMFLAYAAFVSRLAIECIVRRTRASIEVAIRIATHPLLAAAVAGIIAPLLPFLFATVFSVGRESVESHLFYLTMPSTLFMAVVGVSVPDPFPLGVIIVFGVNILAFTLATWLAGFTVRLTVLRWLGLTAFSLMGGPGNVFWGINSLACVFATWLVLPILLSSYTLARIVVPTIQGTRTQHWVEIRVQARYAIVLTLAAMLGFAAPSLGLVILSIAPGLSDNALGHYIVNALSPSHSERDLSLAFVRIFGENIVSSVYFLIVVRLGIAAVSVRPKLKRFLSAPLAASRATAQS